MIRGRVAIELNHIELDPGTPFDWNEALSAPKTLLCQTIARVTLIRLEDPADAGSGVR